MQLIVMGCKPYRDDFRKYLLRAAAEVGDHAVHVYAWERIVVTHIDDREVVLPADARTEEVRSALTLDKTNGPTLVLTGFTGALSPFGFTARKILPEAQFIYDVYDDFAYGASGRMLARFRAVDYRWRRFCDWTVVLEEGLRRLYPEAAHLCNASHLRPVERQHAKSHVVYIGSIDSRVDFRVLEAIAAAGARFDVYGRIHALAPEAAVLLERLATRYGNFSYCGAYHNDDLPEILAGYTIGVVPYKADDRMTRHVNPDKIYHYLNAGLEVVSTPIPQARRMAEFLFLLRSPVQTDKTLAAAFQYSRAEGWRHEAHSWERRWAELRSMARARMPRLT